MTASSSRISSVEFHLWLSSLLRLLAVTLTCTVGECISYRCLLPCRNGFLCNIPRPSLLRPTCLHGAIAGIQPSGDIHVGNYIGCIQPAVQYQDDGGALTFMIADLHATTGQQNKGNLGDTTKKTVATLLACGIDPNKTSIILQSELSSILELHWILGTVISLGRLRKLANFDRREIAQDSDSVGMCLYPLLMSADVLGSGSDLVIAGPDQECHVGLIREVAEKVNRRFSEDVVRLPKLAKDLGFRVLSLDGVGKMSKSNMKASTRLNLLDGDDVLFDKLRSAKTATSCDPSAPEVDNLFRLYSFFSGEPFPFVVSRMGSVPFSIMKEKLQNAMSCHLGRIRARYHELIDNDEVLRRALSDGISRMQPVYERIVGRIKRLSHYYTG